MRAWPTQGVEAAGASVGVVAVSLATQVVQASERVSIISSSRKARLCARNRPLLPATKRGSTRQAASTGAWVWAASTPPPALPYSDELGPRKISMRPVDPKSRLLSWLWPSGMVRGMPSSKTLIPRTPKAARAPKPRTLSRSPWERFVAIGDEQPGHRTQRFGQRESGPGASDLCDHSRSQRQVKSLAGGACRRDFGGRHLVAGLRIVGVGGYGD